MAPAVKTTLKLLLACLLVGMVLSFIDFNALEVLRSAGQAMHFVVERGSEISGWAISYILLGAVVVLPIWLIKFGLKRLKGRKARATKGKAAE